MTMLLLLLGIAALVLVLVLGIGVVVLIKMGVFAKYLFKEEAPDEGDYDIGQSHEVK